PGRLDKPDSEVPYVTFKSASARAEGDYIDAKLAVAMTRQEIGFDQVPTYTDVTSEVTGLSLLGRGEIDREVMGMRGQRGDHPSQPGIRCDGVVIEGVRVDNYALKITLAEEFFCYNDTFNKLGVACGAGQNPHLFLTSNRAAAFGFGCYGTVKCT